MVLEISSQVDPADLAINRRYRSNKTLPREVKDARENLAADIFEAAWNAQYVPPKMMRVLIDFSFLTMKQDLDSPLKHTLDALQDGLRKAGHPTWNDRSIWKLELLRNVGFSGIYIALFQFGT